MKASYVAGYPLSPTLNEHKTIPMPRLRTLFIAKKDTFLNVMQLSVGRVDLQVNNEGRAHGHKRFCRTPTMHGRSGAFVCAVTSEQGSPRGADVSRSWDDGAAGTEGEKSRACLRQ